MDKEEERKNAWEEFKKEAPIATIDRIPVGMIASLAKFADRVPKLEHDLKFALHSLREAAVEAQQWKDRCERLSARLDIVNSELARLGLMKNTKKRRKKS